MKFVVLSLVAVAAGCDPEAPVQSSNVSSEIQSAIEVHEADPTTHSELQIQGSNIIGDGTLSGTLLAAGSVEFAALADDAVASGNIADQSIAGVDIQSDAIATTHIQGGAVNGDKLAADAVTSAKILDGTIQGGVAGDIADGTLTAADLGNNSVGNAEIAGNAVTADKIMDDQIDDSDIANDILTAASLAANSVTDVELANNAVDTNAIANLAVTGAKIANATVTQAKLNTDFNGQGTMDAFTSVFRFTTANNMMTVTLRGVCESDAANAMVRLSDDNEAITQPCPDTDLMAANPPAFFTMTVTTDANDTVIFEYKSNAMGDTTRWKILSFVTSP